MIVVSVLICLASSLITYELNNKRNFGPMLASSIVTISFYMLIKLFLNLNELDLELNLSLIFGASFVGMSSDKVLSRTHIFFAAIGFVFLFAASGKLVGIGVGGKLGLCAFISVYLIRIFTKKKATQAE